MATHLATGIFLRVRQLQTAVALLPMARARIVMPPARVIAVSMALSNFVVFVMVELSDGASTNVNRNRSQNVIDCASQAAYSLAIHTEKPT
jgi:hypothetical protein